MTDHAMSPAEADAAFAAAFASEPRMSEAELVAEILGECTRLGLTCVYRTPRSDRAGIRAGGRGFPDLVIAGPGGILVRECKSAGGETTGNQDGWLYWLHRGGLDCAVWRPADWDSGRIRDELAAVASE